jgi:lipopolysaccharide transport system permease protein
VSEETFGLKNIENTNKTPSLEKKPLVIIEAKPFSFKSLKELWNYRELCYFFIWRDLAIRYRQTLLGVFWAILQPFLTMVILNITLGNLINIFTNNIPPIMFFYSGLTLWTFFSNSLNTTSNSLIEDRALTTKVFFPKITLVMAKVFANLLDLSFSLVIIFFLGIFFPLIISWKFFLLPVVLLLLIIFTSSVGMLIAALNVIYRDVRNTLPFVIQVLFFTTPVLFPLKIIPKEYNWLLALNPLAGIVENFRIILFNQTINLPFFLYTIISTIIIFFFCFYIFSKLEKTFAEKL